MGDFIQLGLGREQVGSLGLDRRRLRPDERRGGDECRHEGRGTFDQALAGDQLYVDLDISVANLPTGARLAVGPDAVIEVTAQPHTGCGKFLRRFGIEAQKLVNSAEGRELNLRGINAKVVAPGTIRTGSTGARPAGSRPRGRPTSSSSGSTSPRSPGRETRRTCDLGDSAEASFSIFSSSSRIGFSKSR